MTDNILPLHDSVQARFSSRLTAPNPLLQRVGVMAIQGLAVVFGLSGFLVLMTLVVGR